MSTTTQQVFRKLLDTFGPQQWWPAETALEVLVGTVLVQNTNWRNVERAIENLRAANALEVSRLLALEQDELESLIRPTGYFRRKAQRLRNLLEFVAREYQGSIDAMRAENTLELRQQLLAVNGIGPETADAILLYALKKPVLVVDAYTKRVYARHGWIEQNADYHQLQQHLVGELPADVETYNELHALLVEVGKRYCRKTPDCEACPLVEMLPDGGVQEA